MLALTGLCLGSQLRAAPYYMPLKSRSQSVKEIVSSSSIRHLIMAFVLSTNGQCVPAWHGIAKYKVASDVRVKKFISELRSYKGDVAVSFGGAEGVELGHTCKSPQQLASAYQLVIDKYHLTNIDLDIEGKASNPADNIRRFLAVKILKQTAKSKGKNLTVSLTIGSAKRGLAISSITQVKQAVSVYKKLIDIYTVM